MIFTYSFILYSFFYLVEGIKLVISVTVVDNPQHSNFYKDSSMRLPLPQISIAYRRLCHYNLRQKQVQLASQFLLFVIFGDKMIRRQQLLNHFSLLCLALACKFRKANSHISLQNFLGHLSLPFIKTLSLGHDF